MKLKVVIGSDHGAIELKQILATHMAALGHSVLDIGVHDDTKVDYPDVAAKLSNIILDGNAQCGVLLCGTGIGMSIAANRFVGIRAALCHDEYTARMSRLHNDANIIVMGGRTTGSETAKAMLDVWLTTSFEGSSSMGSGNRHIARLEKIEMFAQMEEEK